MRPAARVAVPALALVATLALAGCGGRPADRTTSTSAPDVAATSTTDGEADGTEPGTTTGAPTAPTTASDGPVVDQDTLDGITAVLDDAERVLDAVDQEIATDPQE